MIFWIRHYSTLFIQAVGMVLGAVILFLWLCLSVIMLVVTGLLMNKNMVTELTKMDFERIKPLFR